MIKSRQTLIILFITFSFFTILTMQYYRRSTFRYFLCLQTNNWPNVIKLIEKGIDPSTEDKYGHNAMYWAIYKAPTETIKELVKLGVPHKSSGSKGRIPILIAAAEKRWDVVDWLLSMDGQLSEHVLQQLLTESVSQGQLEIVLRLIDMGISPNYYSREGFTPLHTALLSHELIKNQTLVHEIIKVLLKNGADVNALSQPNIEELTSDSHLGRRISSQQPKPRQPITPMDLAVISNNKSIIALLKKYDAVESQDLN